VPCRPGRGGDRSVSPTAKSESVRRGTLSAGLDVFVTVGGLMAFGLSFYRFDTFEDD
jgi:hypothetical protein